MYLASARDLHVLRYFGMQGTVASGLEQIPGPQLRRLLFDRDQANPAIGRLTLVAWDVAHLRNEMPPPIARVLTRLYDAAKFTNGTPHKSPSMCGCRRPRTLSEFVPQSPLPTRGKRGCCCDAASGGTPSRRSAAQELRDQPPLDLEVAVAKLQDEVILARASSSGPDLLEAVKNLRDVNDKLTTQRYYVAAQSAKSPEKSQLWMLLAENSRKLQRTSQPLTRAEEIYRNQPPMMQEVFGAAPSETHEELTREFMQLFAALRKC